MKSEFTGGLLGQIGVGLAVSLLSMITLGLGVPWAICIKERWTASNTVIDGKRLVFDGSAASLFGKYIKWFLLCIITLGIYSLWLTIKMKQWVVEHTHCADNAEK